MTLYNTDALIWKHNVTVWWWFRWKSPGKCEEEDLASCKTIDGAEKEEVHSLETRYILFFSFLKYGNILNGPSASFYYIHITNHWC